LANTKSALKRWRQSEKRRVRNRVHRSRARTAVKKTLKLLTAGEIEAAREATQAAISALDRAAQKGVIHRNNAARRKSRLIKRLRKAIETAGASAQIL